MLILPPTPKADESAALRLTFMNEGVTRAPYFKSRDLISVTQMSAGASAYISTLTLKPRVTPDPPPGGLIVIELILFPWASFTWLVL